MAMALMTVMIMVIMAAAAAMVVIMIVVMMIAVGGAILREHAGDQLGNGFVRGTGDAGVELDVRVIQRDLRAHADAAADQRVNAQFFEQTSQRAVAAAGDGDDRAAHFAVVDLVDLELLGVAKVLEDLAVFVGDCDFHMYKSTFLRKVPIGL